MSASSPADAGAFLATLGSVSCGLPSLMRTQEVSCAMATVMV